jgi:WD40 repeat protein
MAFSSDGRRVLLLPMLKILDTETLEEWGTQLPHDGHYNVGALSTSGRFVAASTNSPYVISVWKLKEDGTVVEHFTLTGHAEWIRSLSFSHDEHHLVSTFSDRAAHMWRITTRKYITLHQPYLVGRAMLSHDGHGPVSNTDRPAQLPTKDLNLIRDAVFSHHDHRIAVGSSIITSIWDALSGRELHRWDIPATRVAFTHDDHYLIAFSDRIRILNTQTFEQKYEYKSYRCWTTLQDGSYYAFSKDGWIYHLASLGARPRKVLWVPPPYRPTLSVLLSALPSSEARIYLPREDGLTTLEIPRDH